MTGKKLILVFSFLLCLSAYSALAQTGSGADSVTITGKVLDQNGQPVVAATVMVKGDPSAGGVLTDANGSYSFTAPKGTILLISCLGYYDNTLTVKPGVRGVIVLQESTESLDDVVIVAYGSQKKESVVGSISQVKGETLVNTGNTNITNAITGKFSGVTTFQTSGQPGSNNSTIYIRGLSSWNGNSPLVIVDGVERDFNSLDPNEVESISVLKDASSTAVYGAKGANGVILVTTKSGEISKPKMSLTANFGIDIPTNLPKHISSYKTALMMNEEFRNIGEFASTIPDEILEEYRNPSSKINSIRYPDVDWFDEMLKSFSTNSNVNYSISGGSKKVKYYIGLGYKHEGSIFKNLSQYRDNNFNYDRINYRSNLDINLTPTTSVDIRLSGYKGIQKAPSDVEVSSLFHYLFKASPLTYVPYYPEWMLEEIPDINYPDASGIRLVADEGHKYASSLYGHNAYIFLASGDYTQTINNNFNADLELKQKLDFITKGLKASAMISYTTNNRRESETGDGPRHTYYIDWDAYDAGLNPWTQGGGSTVVYEETPYKQAVGGVKSYNYAFYWKGSLDYARTFGDHEVTALGVFTQRDYRVNKEFERRYESLAGRATYSFKHMYLLEANVGYTGSEQFSPKNRFGFFPSIAAGFVPSEYKWWKSSMPWWSKFKLRYSDGLVGSDAASDRWLYYSYYTTSGSVILEGEAANSTAKWETARKRDLGIEMGFFKNNLKFNIDLFDEYRSGILAEPITTFYLASNMKAANIGEMKKHGIEIEVSYNHQFSNGLEFNISAMGSFSENRIMKYVELDKIPDYQKYAGSAYGANRNGMNLVDSGYYETVDDIHNYISYSTAGWGDGIVVPGCFKYLDYNADGELTSMDMHCVKGNEIAPATYSLSLGVKYRRFQASMMFYGTAGKWINYNTSYEVPFTYGDKKVTASSLDYWTPTNKSASHAAITNDYMYMFAGGGRGGSKYYIQTPGSTWRKSDFVTLKDVYVSYDIPFRSKKVINSLQVYVTGSNLFNINSLPEGDPQVKELANGFYPMQASVRIGIKAGF